MINIQLKFVLQERKNLNKTEYCLNVFIDNNPDDKWNICVWKKKPKESVIKEIKEIVLRSFLICTETIKLPKITYTELP